MIVVRSCWSRQTQMRIARENGFTRRRHLARDHELVTATVVVGIAHRRDYPRQASDVLEIATAHLEDTGIEAGSGHCLAFRLSRADCAGGQAIARRTRQPRG